MSSVKSRTGGYQKESALRLALEEDSGACGHVVQAQLSGPALRRPSPLAREIAARHAGDQLQFALKGTRASTDQVRQTAVRGVQGSNSKLPFFELIQSSFGIHDVSDVCAHTGGAAREASKSIGATAYATGNHIAFASTPDLHTAAHEAAHVVQQRRGVSLSGGVGQVGDAYERNADEVTDRVVRGQSAEDLLGGGRTQQGVSNVQRLSSETGRSVQRRFMSQAMYAQGEHFVGELEQSEVESPEAELTRHRVQFVNHGERRRRQASQSVNASTSQAARSTHIRNRMTASGSPSHLFLRYNQGYEFPLARDFRRRCFHPSRGVLAVVPTEWRTRILSAGAGKSRPRPSLPETRIWISLLAS